MARTRAVSPACEIGFLVSPLLAAPAAACSRSKPADEVAQTPGRPAMTSVAGRSNGGAIASEAEDGQWVRPAKNYASTRFSGLNEITTANVQNLRLAWTFETGVLRGQEAAPLIVNNPMYNGQPFP